MKKPKETFDKWYYTVCNSSDSRVELAKKAFDRGRKFEKEQTESVTPKEVKKIIKDGYEYSSKKVPWQNPPLYQITRTKYIG